MDIVFCTDDNFIMPCGISIISLLENNKNEKITIHILGLELSSTSIEKIKIIAKKYSSKIIFYKISNDMLQKYKFPVEEIGLARITITTYIKLLLIDILPKDIEKIIYLDCDIMVVGNLSELWNIDISNNSLAGVIEDLAFLPETFTRLSYPNNYSYINAGVLLINLAYWREHNIIKLFMSFLIKNRDKIIYHDQDVINGTLYESIKLCPYRYNMHTAFYQENETMINAKELNIERQNPVIVHYSRGKKPWFKDAFVVRLKEYRKYYKKSPWKNEPLKWTNTSTKYKVRFYVKNILISLGLKKNRDKILGIK